MENKNMLELIKKLTEAWGPSGYEHQVRALIREEVADLADEIRVDGLGNLICRVGSGGKRSWSAPTWMKSA
jgi:putative aminopeptidase FrvX